MKLINPMKKNSKTVLFSFCLTGIICFNGILVSNIHASDDFFPIFDMNSEMINKKEKTTVSFPLPNLSNSGFNQQSLSQSNSNQFSSSKNNELSICMNILHIGFI
jgi:hypothetical protein